jgi:hypothetical protein
MGGILVREMPLFGFDMFSKDKKLAESRVVKSLRTQGIDPMVKKILDDVHIAVVQEELLRSRNVSSEAAQQRALLLGVEASKLKNKEDNDLGSVNTGKGPSQAKGAEKVEEAKESRREMRKQRKTDLLNHTELRPGENDDDIRDNTAIRLAEKTIGDYKLKVADDYEIPQENRINATKKKSQMALLEVYICIYIYIYMYTYIYLYIYT